MQRDTAEWRKLIFDTQVNLYFVDVEPDSRVHAATRNMNLLLLFFESLISTRSANHDIAETRECVQTVSLKISFVNAVGISASIFEFIFQINILRNLIRSIITFS